eukprot:TRINITY_DN20545_c0_g3_i2.p1 TRINITY_DN20545_c0_g3~~TRINITY_DN20545_c0_g3_i2.p1  ORF type:complete len:928 (-),score=241.60 TRINITY_DN20545_c0_g3_i2:324-3107(-)
MAAPSLSERLLVGGQSERFKSTAFFSKHFGAKTSADLVEELRDARRKKRTLASFGATQDRDTSVPNAAYTAVCPAELLCGVESQSLPCGQSLLVQAAFGNPADALTRAGVLEADEDDGAHNGGATINLGLPSLEEMGWEEVPEPKMFKLLEDDIHKSAYLSAIEALGAKHVRRPSEPDDRIMVSFPKSDIPASKKDVDKLIKKLKQIDHANIVAFVDACEDGEAIHLIYECCGGAGCLPSRILVQEQLLPVRDSARLVQQLSAALAVGTRNSLNHLGMSIWNVVSLGFEAVFPVKLFGLGLAGVMFTGKQGSMCRDSHYYRPPELCRIWLERDAHEPFKKVDPLLRVYIDVYAVGAITYTSLCGHTTVGGVDEESVMNRCIETKPKFESDLAHLEAAGIELLEATLQANPQRRPKPEALIMNSWLGVHVRSIDDKDHVFDVVDKLKAFSSMTPIMKTIGRVLAKNLRSEKVRILEDSFNMLDTKGDGELDAAEISSFLADGRDELKILFQNVDTNSNGCISMNEFVVACVFGEGILTERLLQRTFEALDADGTGEITAVELYSALTKIEDTLSPEEVANFMGDADRDWDADIDFDEFRAFFPQVKCRQEEFDMRVMRAGRVMDVTLAAFKKFNEECQQWRSLVQEELGRLQALRDAVSQPDNDTGHGCTREWLAHVSGGVRKMLFYFKHTPEVVLEDADLETYRACSFELDLLKNKLKKKTGAASAHGAAGPRASGPFALDEYFVFSRNGWTKAVTQMTHAVKAMETEPSKVRRRTEIMLLVSELEDRCTGIQRDITNNIREQQASFEASRLEDGMPKIRFTKRSISATTTQDGEAAAAIEKYRRERQIQAEQDTKKKREEEEAQRNLHKMSTEAERRGIVFAARRQKKQSAKQAVAGTFRQPESIGEYITRGVKRLHGTLLGVGSS